MFEIGIIMGLWLMVFAGLFFPNNLIGFAIGATIGAIISGLIFKIYVR